MAVDDLFIQTKIPLNLHIYVLLYTFCFKNIFLTKDTFFGRAAE